MTLTESTYRLGEALQARNFKAIRAALREMAAAGNVDDGSYFKEMAAAAQNLDDDDFAVFIRNYVTKTAKWWPMYFRRNLKGNFSWQ